MTDSNSFSGLLKSRISRRSALKGLAATAAIGTAPGYVRYAQAQSSEPIRIGFQAHRTGIGAAYGRWYERTTAAATKIINDAGGINGRPIEIITEDDGTDPARGAEVVEKFANLHKTDVVFGTLFSHVVVGSAPAAGELKMPYYVVSEGYHVASGKLNRYVLQPGITDVKAQTRSVAPWIAGNVGKKITMIYPSTRSKRSTSTARGWNSSMAAISGKARHAISRPTRPMPRRCIARRSASTRTAPASTIPRTFPPPRICSAAGRRSM